MSRLAIPTDTLRHAIRRSAMLTTNRSDRSPVLNCTEFQVSSEGLRLVSTDGWRIAQVNLPIDHTPDIGGAPLIDNDFLRWLHMRLRGMPSIEITFSPGEVAFQVGNHQFPAKLVSYAFPEWQKEVVGMQDFEIAVPRQPFAEALQKVVADSVILKIADGAVALRAVNGSAIGSVPTTTPIACALDIMAGPKFLLDFAVLAESEVLRLAYSGSPREPIRLEADAGHFVYYLMPKTAN